MCTVIVSGRIVKNGDLSLNTCMLYISGIRGFDFYKRCFLPCSDWLRSDLSLNIIVYQWYKRF